MLQKPGVMIYFEVMPTIEKLSNAKAGLLFKAILEYGQDRKIPAFRNELDCIWPLIQARLDTDDLRYYQVAQKKRYAAYTRWAKKKGLEPLPYDCWLNEPDKFMEEDPLD